MKKIFGLLTALLVAVAGLTSCVTTYDDKDYGIEDPTVLASNAGNYAIGSFSTTAEGYTAEVSIPAVSELGNWGGAADDLCFGIVYGTKDSPAWSTKYTGGSGDGTSWTTCTLGAGANNVISGYDKTAPHVIVIRVSGTTVSYKLKS